MEEGHFDYDYPINRHVEAVREYALVVGAEHPEWAWILTDYDTWEPNPFYQGPPAPHPEFDWD